MAGRAENNWQVGSRDVGGQVGQSSVSDVDHPFARVEGLNVGDDLGDVASVVVEEVICSVGTGHAVGSIVERIEDAEIGRRNRCKRISTPS